MRHDVEQIELGEYHAEIFASSRDRYPVALGGRRYCAVGIGRDSDIDAIDVLTGQGWQTIDLGSPYIGDIESLTVRPFYEVGDTAAPNAAAMPGTLALALYPTEPLVWPTRRGPKKGETLARTASGIVEDLPAYGRREARIWIASTTGTANVRIEAARVHSDGTLIVSPVWPDPNDATAFEAIANGAEKAVLALEGWEFLRVRKSASVESIDLLWSLWD